MSVSPSPAPCSWEVEGGGLQGRGLSDRHSVFFGPFLHDPDDVLDLGVACASQ